MKKLVVPMLAFVLLFLVACAPADGERRDGQYEIEVSFAGGSGRASISSPASVTLLNGEMTAKIVWSSPNYDYMMLDGVKYLPINKEGNAIFEVPVPAMDREIAISAETTAMSQPHVIDYTLYFDSETLHPVTGGLIWIMIGAAVMVAVVTVIILRKHRQKANHAA